MGRAYKLAGRLFLRRLRSSLTALLILFLAIGLEYGIYCGVDNLSALREAKATRLYGQHQGLFYQLQPEQLSALQETPGVETGVACLLEQGETQHMTLSIGWLDENFRDIGCIGLAAGSYPQADGELAIEEYVAIQAGGLEPGDRLTLTVQGKPREYIITGILYSYSNLWERGVNEELTFANSLPNALCPETEAEPIARQAIIKVTLPLPPEAAIQYCTDLAERLELPDVIINRKVLQSDNNQDIQLISLMKWVFTLGLCLACGMVLRALYAFTLPADRYRLELLYALGGDRKLCRRTVAAEQLMLKGLALSLGIGLGMLLTRPLFTFIAEQSIAAPALFQPVPLLLGLAMAFMDGWLRFRILFPMRSRERGPGLVLPKALSPRRSLLRLLGRGYGKRFFPAVLSLGLCIGLFCLAMQFSLGLTLQQSLSGPDYLLYFPEGNSYWRIGPYYANASGNGGLPFSLARELGEREGVSLITGRPGSMDTLLELDAEDMNDYWRSLDNMVSGQDMNPGLFFSSWTPLHMLEYRVLPEELFSRLQAQVSPGSETAEGLLFLLENGGLAWEGTLPDTLTLGRVEYSGGTISKDTLHYKSFTVPVTALATAYAPDWVGTAASTPVLVVSLDYTERTGLFTGYEEVEIALDGTDSQRAELDTAIQQLAATLPNTGYFSSGENQQRILQLQRVLRLLLTILCGALGLFGVGTMVLVSALRIEERRPELCLYQALGLPRKRLTEGLFTDMLLNIAQALLIGAVSLTAGNLAAGWGLTYLPAYGKLFLGSGMAVAALCLGGLLLPLLRLYRSSPGQGLAYDE